MRDMGERGGDKNRTPVEVVYKAASAVGVGTAWRKATLAKTQSYLSTVRYLLLLLLLLSGFLTHSYIEITRCHPHAFCAT